MNEGAELKNEVKFLWCRFLYETTPYIVKITKKMSISIIIIFIIANIAIKEMIGAKECFGCLQLLYRIYHSGVLVTSQDKSLRDIPKEIFHQKYFSRFNAIFNSFS